MRPRYETETDLANEAAVVNVVASRWLCECRKLPLRYELDYAIYKDNFLRAYLEIKCRSVASNQYATVILSAAKVATAKQLSAAAGVPSILVVSYTDLDLWIDISKADAKYSPGGRSDRGDAQDLEPVAHFYVEEMKVL